MFCQYCGKEITDDAKFCKYCGKKVKSDNIGNSKNKNTSNKKDNKSSDIWKYAFIGTIIIIISILIAAVAIGAFDDFSVVKYNYSSDNKSSENNQASEVSSYNGTAKSWQSVGTFSGSGTGSKTITVPKGQIKIEISAYPIKNYGYNHLYAKGSNGESAGVDWGPKSAVATRSDSVSFTSSSETTFTLDYYETVSWNVNVLKYQ